VKIRPGDTVFDCGAHVGMFAAAALEQGAGMVYCYEPVPKNLERLKENLKSYGKKAVIVAAAMMGERTKTVAMSLSSFDGAHQLVSITENLGKAVKRSVSVRALSFRNCLLKRKPDVIKLDVEAAEYEIMKSLHPGDLESVRCLFIEFHPIKNRDQKIAAVRRYIVSEGFRVVSDRKRAFVAWRIR